MVFPSFFKQYHSGKKDIKRGARMADYHLVF